MLGVGRKAYVSCLNYPTTTDQAKVDIPFKPAIGFAAHFLRPTDTCFKSDTAEFEQIQI
jgi:hypothetical protein